LLKVALNSIIPYWVRYWIHWDYNKILKLSPSREAIPLIRSLFSLQKRWSNDSRGGLLYHESCYNDILTTKKPNYM
jgi:hypothetical protein